MILRTLMNTRENTSEAVYFDSNVLRKANWPDPSARLLELLGKAADLGITPSLVELVRQELVESWVRDLYRDRRSYSEKGRELARRSLGLIKTSEPSRLPPADEMRAHVAAATAKITQRFRLVPTTTQPLERFTRLAMSRGGAFVEGGKGFNDTVILVSIVEDMTNRGMGSAILVSEDRGFQNEGMAQVTGDRQLRIVPSIEAVDEILDRLLSERVHAHLEAKKQEVLAAVAARKEELSDFLRGNLTLSQADFQMVDMVQKVEFLDVVELIDAHSSPFLIGQENREENRVSVDAKIRVRLETATFLFERQRARIDAGGDQLEPGDIMISTGEKEVVVTVEGAAEVTKEGIQAIKYFRAEAKKRSGFGDLLGLVVPQK